ncbi:hypothetical protein, partial [Buttiauxella sp. B2]|uniref:hypothetical protein n=1 Tax=Buttiauxella sp. B2 TaxID=2587812 RepID=UPI001CB9919E
VALTSQSGGLLSAPGSTLTLLPGAMFSPVTGNTLAQGKVFNARLEIEPVLTDSDARVTRSQSNEANLSFELME